jgi:hypothetical protein
MPYHIPIDLRSNRFFTKRGELLRYGNLANPKAVDIEGDTEAARIFVGFNVGDKPTWTLEDLVDLVERTRASQRVDPNEPEAVQPDATFYATRGLYTHKDGKHTVREEGGQVIILSIFGESVEHFQANIIAVAFAIVTQFRQAEVIVEFQLNGVKHRTVSVQP